MVKRGSPKGGRKSWSEQESKEQRTRLAPGPLIWQDASKRRSADRNDLRSGWHRTSDRHHWVSESGVGLLLQSDLDPPVLLGPGVSFGQTKPDGTSPWCPCAGANRPGRHQRAGNEAQAGRRTGTPLRARAAPRQGPAEAFGEPLKLLFRKGDGMGAWRRKNASAGVLAARAA